MNPQVIAAIGPAAVLLLVTLCYSAACWIKPFKRCGRCDGTGRRPPHGRTFRLCRRCDGTGRRLRAGRWIYNQLSRLRKEANR